MKKILNYGLALGICLSPFILSSQLTFSSGATTYTVYVLPFVPTCIANGTTSATAITITATFQFNDLQISTCPNSGGIYAPGSVVFGGTGSSASFDHYHSVSYSSSNENQQLEFSAPVNVFQFSTSGEAISAAAMRVHVYNGATLLGSYDFITAGPGNYNTYNIVDSGTGFTRIAFEELNAINADDELIGDFYINDELVTLSNTSLNFSASIEKFNEEKAFLTWNGRLDQELKHFNLHESTNGIDWNLIHTQSVLKSSNFYSYSTMIRTNTQYYYKLDALDENMELIDSQIRDLKMVKNDLTLFPNPTSKGFYLTNEGNFEQGTLTLVNVLGKEHQFSPNESSFYSTTELASGIYFIKETGQKLLVKHE